MDNKRKLEIKQIVEHFRGQTVDAQALTDYCSQNGIEPITTGEYSDWLYQYNFDEKVRQALPELISVLSQWQFLGEFAAAEDQAAQYLDIEKKMCQALEKYDFQFQELELLSRNLATAFHGMVKNIAVRAGDIRLGVVNTLLMQKFGVADMDLVPFKDYAETSRAIAAQVDAK